MRGAAVAALLNKTIQAKERKERKKERKERKEKKRKRIKSPLV